MDSCRGNNWLKNQNHGLSVLCCSTSCEINPIKDASSITTGSGSSWDAKSYDLALHRCPEEGARSDREEDRPEDKAKTSSSSTDEVEELRPLIVLHNRLL